MVVCALVVVSYALAQTMHRNVSYFHKVDSNTCLSTEIGGIGIYGSCIIAFSGLTFDLHNPFCISYRGLTFLNFVMPRQPTFWFILPSIIDITDINFYPWNSIGDDDDDGGSDYGSSSAGDNGSQFDDACIIDYQPGAHITINSLTSQLVAPRQVSTLAIENYDYRDCFYSDQALILSVVSTTVEFVAEMSPTHKCTEIPRGSITSCYIFIGYLDEQSNVKNFYDINLKPSIFNLGSSALLFSCKDKCYKDLKSLLRSPFVFSYIFYNISIGGEPAYITNKILGLRTMQDAGCFENIRVQISKRAISVSLKRTLSVLCFLSETKDNIPIIAVRPELAVFAPNQVVRPVRLSAVKALNLINGEGVIMYSCTNCTALLKSAPETIRDTYTINRTAILADFLLVKELANGETEIARHPVDYIEVASWDTASVAIEFSLLKFKAYNSILREKASLYTNCTHVQLIFALKKVDFRLLFEGDILIENRTETIPLINTYGTLVGVLDCLQVTPHRTLENTCKDVVRMLLSKKYRVYYRLAKSDGYCGKVQHVDKIITAAIFQHNIWAYLVIIIMFFAILLFLFILLIYLEDYGNRYSAQ